MKENTTMQKEVYEEAEMEVVAFENEDVIATSYDDPNMGEWD